MKKLLLVLPLIIASCATDSQYDRGNIDYYMRIADEAAKNGGELPQTYSPPDRNIGQYFKCLNKYNQKFNSDDARWICE